MKRFATLGTAAVLAMSLAACAGEEAFDEDEEAAASDDGKYEAWDSANNPARVDNTFIYEVDQLPLEGRVKDTPWPGDYWATARDSVNHRWDGAEPSPAEKVEQAFGLTGFATKVTNEFGIFGHDLKECQTGADCTGDDAGSCVKPRGHEGAGRCVPTWWGICHGWAPAAFSEPAPTKPVVHNGVTFYPGDLEGLMSLAYSEGLPTKFLSRRCNRDGGDVGRDNTGRVREGECRDMNPGSFHVIATNFLGLRKAGFVEDRTYDAEVWNQPVLGYRITNGENGKLKEITKAEAIAKLGGGLSFENLQTDTEIAKDAKVEGTVTGKSGVIKFRVTGTGDVDLYVKKGQAATTGAYDCMSNGGSSAEECELTVAAGDTVHYLVLGYAATSKVSLQLGSPSENGAEYIYNTAAQRFFYVEMDFDYVTESSPSRSSHVQNIDSYTNTDSYQYILEADADGRVIGGEWVGDSQISHPDFVWWPTDKPYGTLPGGLTYAMVKELFNKAQESTPMPETTVLLDNVKVTRVSTYFPIGVPAGKKLTITMTGNNNADLYVRMGRKPTVVAYDKASTGPDSNETVTVTAPDSGGTYYVRVRPTRTSVVTVKATIE